MVGLEQGAPRHALSGEEGAESAEHFVNCAHLRVLQLSPEVQVSALIPSPLLCHQMDFHSVERASDQALNERDRRSGYQLGKFRILANRRSHVRSLELG